MYILYFVLAFLVYFIISKLNNDYYHPIAIACLSWFLTASLSSYEPLYVKGLQHSWGLAMHACVLLAGIGLCLLNFLYYKRIKNNIKLLVFTKLYQLIVNLLMFFSYVSFFIRFKSVLFSPPLLADGVSDVKNHIPSAIPGVNYLELLIPFLMLCAVFELFFSLRLVRKRKWVLFSYLFFSLLILVFYKVSRGDLFVFFFGTTYLYYVRHGFSLPKLIVIFTSLLIFTLSFTFIRISSGSLVVSYWGDSSGILSLISPIYTYVAPCFENLNKLISNIYTYTYYDAVWGEGLFKPIVGKGQYSDVVYYNTLFFNARTYVYSFYQDLGLLGVFIYSLILSIIINLIYYFSRRDSRFLLVASFLQKAIVFMFFGNYFFGELVLIFPYIICIFLLLLIRNSNVDLKGVVYKEVA